MFYICLAPDYSLVLNVKIINNQGGKHCMSFHINNLRIYQVFDEHHTRLFLRHWLYL